MTWGDSAAVSALKYACKALRPGQIHTVSPFAAAGSPTTTQARVQSRVVTWAMEEGVRGATSTFMWRLAQAKALGWPGFAGIFQGRQNAMLYYLTINKLALDDFSRGAEAPNSCSVVPMPWPCRNTVMVALLHYFLFANLRCYTQGIYSLYRTRCQINR